MILSRACIRKYCGGAFLALAQTSPAFAEEPQAGLPQFDVSYFPSQIFWLLITFCVLYVLMARIALPRVAATQGARQEAIETDLKAATAASEQAKLLALDYDKSLHESRMKAAQIIAEMNQSMAHIASDKRSQLQADLTKRLQEAEIKIKARTEETLHGLDKSLHELSQAIVNKVVRSRS